MATQITTAIGPGERWLVVDAASTTQPPFLFRLDGELLRCVDGGGTLHWYCERGVNGTAAASHGATTAIAEAVLATESLSPGYTSSTSPGDLPTNGVGIGMWANAKASGDHRTIYARLYAAAAGAAGEAVRAYGTVVAGIAAAVGGTINGLHASLLVKAGGSVSGAGNAIRATLETDASTTPGGTLAVIRADTNFGTSSVPPATAAFLALDNLGTPKLDLLAMITNPSTTMIANAGTGANSAAVSTGGVAAKVAKITVDGTPYWIPLFSSNS